MRRGIFYLVQTKKLVPSLPREVCFYEATFLSGLRFPVHPFIRELLHHLGIAPGQLMPNSWQIIISCMEIWMIVTEGDMIRLDEFVFLYCLKESKEFGYYELVPWDRKSRLVFNLPSSFHYWKSRYFFVFGDSWETLSNDFCGDVPRLERRWGTSKLGASSLVCHSLMKVFLFRFESNFFFFLFLYLATRVCPKLKSRYKGNVKDASDYAKTK